MWLPCTYPLNTSSACSSVRAISALQHVQPRRADECQKRSSREVDVRGNDVLVERSHATSAALARFEDPHVFVKCVRGAGAPPDRMPGDDDEVVQLTERAIPRERVPYSPRCCVWPPALLVATFVFGRGGEEVEEVEEEGEGGESGEEGEREVGDAGASKEDIAGAAVVAGCGAASEAAGEGDGQG